MNRGLHALARWELVAALSLGVCLGQFPGVGGQRSIESAASVASIAGDVSVLKDSVPWALSVGDAVYPRQIIVSGPDGYAIFEVSDGSTFEVYPNSRVIFRNNPSSWTDLLDLWLGRVKIHIQKLGGGPNRNRIHTPTAVISVRGTSFDVALEDDDTTWVAVEEGSVAVRHRLIPQNDETVLNAGEQRRVYKDVSLAKAKIDKGPLAERALDSLSDALYIIFTRGTGGATPGGTGPSGGGPSLPGDTPAENPPPAPPSQPGDGGATLPPPPPPGN
jgi:hypothetical protein